MVDACWAVIDMVQLAEVDGNDIVVHDFEASEVSVRAVLGVACALACLCTLLHAWCLTD